MKSLLKKIRNKLLSPIEQSLNRIEKCQSNTVSSVSQLVLKNQYKMLSKNDLSKYSFNEVGFRVFSQNSEDGILLFIFSLIGTTNNICLEICAGDGIQCNTANLIINHGWSGLLFDGDLELVNKGRAFYSKHPDTFCFPPKFVHAWITKSNINELIRSNGVEGEIELLSLDMDGIDYWIWDALNTVNPRVVVVEIQCIWGTERTVTVPYSDNFKTKLVNGYGIYSGASLPAFIKLAQRKGYRLVGVEKYGFNAFFIRNDIGIDIFPEANAEKCLDVPFVRWAKDQFLQSVKEMPWEEV